MRVTPEGFGELAARAGRVCERRALILEGGYNLDTLPGLVRPVVEAL
jgi:acetoin utilization deacetylase AcuC-like enzyme